MHPDWVTKHKQKNTNISYINGHYYLYKVTTIWNKEKKRPQKITKQYLGKITPNGLIPKKTQPPKITTPPTTKEYGATNTIQTIGKDTHQQLQQTFGQYHANLIFTLATLRVIHQTPLKRIQHHYQHSYISETYPDLKLSSKNLSEFLKTFGNNRQKIVEFMQHHIGADEHILFDTTSIISKSKKLYFNRKGYNANHDFDPQINLLYAFASKSKMPVYYRIIPGNVRDVSAFKLSIVEAGLKDVVVIADKGFGSQANFSMLDDAGLLYVVPLRRDSLLFDDSRLRLGDKSVFDGFFIFNGRPVWFYGLGGGVFVFLDSVLKVEEEKRYLVNVERGLEGFCFEGFVLRQFKFGVIVLRCNLVGRSAEEVFLLYKERLEVELFFDFLKNLLLQDRSYMQCEESLESWAFVNYVSLLLVYRLYDLLRVNGLLSRFSVADFLAHLRYIFKIKINGEWYLSEITKKTTALLETLNLPST